jgi:hypothetical protein
MNPTWKNFDMSKRAVFAAGVLPAEGQESHDVSKLIQPELVPPDFRIARCKRSGLTLGIAPRDQTRALIERVNPRQLPSTYLLEGMDGDNWAVREGRSIRIGGRIPNHANDPRLDFYDRVAIFAGPGLRNDDTKVVECLWARQIAHVDKVTHFSRGPEMPNVDASAWRAGGEAYLRSLLMAPMLGITYLQPKAIDDIATVANAEAGFLDRWSPNSVEWRNSRFLRDRSGCGALLEFIWGDFVAVAEFRNDRAWLLKGSQIRKMTVACAPKWHRQCRDKLAAKRLSSPVLGYPDRVWLKADFEVGTSLAGLTQFVKGSADSSTDCWREFQPRFSSGSSHSPEMN